MKSYILLLIILGGTLGFSCKVSPPIYDIDDKGNLLSNQLDSGWIYYHNYDFAGAER
jgi:hypothetical protein